jgi:hypothetical protein
MEGSDHRLFEAIFRLLCKGTDKGHEEPQSG